MLRAGTKNVFFGCLGTFLFLGITACHQPPPRRAIAVWSMLAVNETIQQADAHLIETESGKLILVDVGFTDGAIVEHLNRRQVKRVDLILISHPHKDHYGGLRAMMGSKIEIGEVRMNIPVQKICDLEIPWGCDYQDLVKLKAEMFAAKIPLLPMAEGDVLVAEPQVSALVLAAFDGVNTPVGETDINDTSVIIRFDFAG